MSETKFKVKIDTGQAKGQLRGLTKEASRVASGVSGRIRSFVGRGMTAVGLGAGLGAGIAAVRQVASSGIGDVVGEYTTHAGAMANEALTGDFDDKARASQSAREQTMQVFALQAGQTGVVPQGAFEFYNGIKALREQEELGRSKIAQDERFYSKAAPGDLWDQATTSLSQAVMDGFEWLWKKLSGQG